MKPIRDTLLVFCARCSLTLLPTALLLTALGLVVLPFGKPFRATLYAQQSGSDSAAHGLFLPVSDAQSDGQPLVAGAAQSETRMITLRSQSVRVDWTALGVLPDAVPAADLAPAARQPADRDVRFNLFADTQFQVHLSAWEPNPTGGGLVWFGEVMGVPQSTVQLAIKDGLLAADLRLPARSEGGALLPTVLYQVRPATQLVTQSSPQSLEQIYLVRQVRVAGVLDEVPDFRRPPLASSTQSQQSAPRADQPTALADDGSTIDLLVAYTPAARQAIGGAAAMLLEIDLAVAQTNQAYANSAINQRLRLVDTVEVAYTESNIGTDLDRLTDQNDGYMDTIHARRNQVGADVVSLLLVNPTNTAGIGWLLTPVDPSFEAYAFNVVDICCATGGLVFAHELGHNMGAAHDWYVDDSPGAFDYSHGYVGPACTFKTIMAYGDECSWFDPIPYFSNPAIQVNGVPIGVSPGTNLNCRVGNRNNPLCDADNRLTLNNSARTVANFRQSITQPQPTATTAPPTATPRPTATALPPATTTAAPPSTATATPTVAAPSTRTPIAPTVTPTVTVMPTCTATPTRTPVSTDPSLTIVDSPTVGAPGSAFVIAGANFRRNRRVALAVNEVDLATVRTDDQGHFTLFVVTLPATSAGQYTIRTLGTQVAAITFTLDPAAALIEPPVSGLAAVILPDGLAPQSLLYLPLVQQGDALQSSAGPASGDPCK